MFHLVVGIKHLCVSLSSVKSCTEYKRLQLLLGRHHFKFKESKVLSMQILVSVLVGEKPGEWIIIELQGDLESREHSCIAGKFIGDLHFSNQGIPILIIGHHILHGKIMQLDKPLAVLEKVHTHEKACKHTEKTSSAYVVKAVVSKKLLFKTRPKPIIANIYSGPC